MITGIQVAKGGFMELRDNLMLPESEEDKWLKEWWENPETKPWYGVPLNKEIFSRMLTGGEA